MVEWVTKIVESLGYWGIAFLMFAENLVPPIPSEVIMPAAGFATAKGELNFWLVVLAGSLGALVGGTFWYFVGRWMGLERIRRWADRYGRWLTITSKEIDRAAEWFARWERTAVFVCRFVPGVRTFISIPAGFARMPIIPFLLYSLAGTLIWTTALAWLGRVLRDNYEILEKYLGPIGYAILGALLVWFIVWVVRRKKRMRAALAPTAEFEQPKDV